MHGYETLIFFPFLGQLMLLSGPDWLHPILFSLLRQCEMSPLSSHLPIPQVNN